MSRLQLNSEDLLLVDDLVLGWVWFFRYNYLSNFKSDFYAVKNNVIIQLDLVDLVLSVCHFHSKLSKPN